MQNTAIASTSNLEMAAEVYVVVVWHSAMFKAEDILSDLRSRFTPLEVREIAWSRRDFRNNLTRFYRTALPSGSDKERHCGTGPFLLCIVKDDAPEYGARSGSKGPALVNTRLFDAREQYRAWTGGGYRIHASVTAQETARDLFLLTGKTPESLLSKDQAAWDGRIQASRANLIGSPEWHSFEQLFHALDCYVDYVAFSPCESAMVLEDPAQVADVPRIVLSNDRWDAVYIANARPVASVNNHRRHEVTVRGSRILLEFRQAGHGYWDTAWEQAIFDTRTRLRSGVWVPSPEQYRWLALYEKIFRPVSVERETLLLERTALAEYMRQHAYRHVRVQRPQLDVDGWLNWIGWHVRNLVPNAGRTALPPLETSAAANHPNRDADR